MICDDLLALPGLFCSILSPTIFATYTWNVAWLASSYGKRPGFFASCPSPALS